MGREVKEMRYSDKEKEIFTKIRHFFLERNKGNYEEAAKTVESLGITRIEISLNKMRICLRRPGLLIGKKGECNECGEFNQRLVYGKCSPCRDGRY